MKSSREIDGVLVEWGARLFYPPNRVLGRYRRGEGLRIPRSRPPTADHVRRHIAAALRRAPQVMVKVTGGGRGMSRIAAHLRYISRRGTLPLENERGEKLVGAPAVRELANGWRFGGTYIADDSHRREAFNIMFSMPPETDGEAVRGAVREVAQREFANHAYAFVLHEPGADDPRTERPHVHLVVRAEGFDGRRLNPRKPDLQRWREAFAERLQERGIDASATRRAARGQIRSPVRQWEWHAKNRRDREMKSGVGGAAERGSGRPSESHRRALNAWREMARVLAESSDTEDRSMAIAMTKFVAEMPAARAFSVADGRPTRTVHRKPDRSGPDRSGEP